MTPDLIEEMLAHAREESPRECCGLVVAKTGSKKPVLVRAKNVAEQGCLMFELDGDAWLRAAEIGEVVAVYHSHPRDSAQPSEADKVACEAMGVPWYIVAPWNGDASVYKPCGYAAEYELRPFFHGVLDCYALIRDWYNREWNLGMNDYPRQWEWWDRGQNMYEDNYAKEGFVNLGDGVKPQLGDLFLMQLGSDVPNHAAVFIGDGRILHHVRGRLSSVENYGGMWLKHTVRHLRHRTRM